MQFNLDFRGMIIFSIIYRRKSLSLVKLNFEYEFAFSECTPISNILNELHKKDLKQ